LGFVSGCDRISELQDKLLGSNDSSEQEPAELRDAKNSYEQGRIQDAIQRLEQYTAQEPTSAQGFYYLGLCYLSMAGQEVAGSSPLTPEEQKSLDAFQRAITLNPRYALAYIGIGDLYVRRVPARRPRRRKNEDPNEDPYELALASYQNAVTIDPMLPEAQMHYARFLQKVQNLEEAELAFKAAAEAAATIPEKAPDYYLAYGRFLVDTDRLDEALDQYELAQMFRQGDLEIQRELAVAHARLGQKYFDAEQYSLAEQELTTASGMFPDPNDPEAQKASATMQQLRSIRRR
jgi:tetratricopeptide (TPR) repeat protein